MTDQHHLNDLLERLKWRFNFEEIECSEIKKYELLLIASEINQYIKEMDGRVERYEVYSILRNELNRKTVNKLFKYLEGFNWGKLMEKKYKAHI